MIAVKKIISVSYLDISSEFLFYKVSGLTRIVMYSIDCDSSSFSFLFIDKLNYPQIINHSSGSEYDEMVGMVIFRVFSCLKNFKIVPELILI